ncbi:MAG: sarcosine oxidase subunit gamma family protein [Hyphomicrobiaceae bacterium]|nr:sarcosine oxidase subunit gamma family protein [Hyphomicrobiaceae bacterium]
MADANEPLRPATAWQDALEIGDFTATPIEGRTTLLLAVGPASERDVRRVLADRLGLDLPQQCRAVTSAGVTLASIGPGKWLAIADAVEAVPSARRLADVLAGTLADLPASLVDVSDGYAALRLSGEATRDVLMRLVPVDVDRAAFSDGAVAATHMEHVGVILIRTDAADGFELLAPRSFAVSLAGSIETAARTVAASRRFAG